MLHDGMKMLVEALDSPGPHTAWSVLSGVGRPWYGNFGITGTYSGHYYFHTFWDDEAIIAGIWERNRPINASLIVMGSPVLVCCPSMLRIAEEAHRAWWVGLKAWKSADVVDKSGTGPELDARRWEWILEFSKN